MEKNTCEVDQNIKEIRKQFIREMQEFGHYIPIYFLKMFKEKGLI